MWISFKRPPIGRPRRDWPVVAAVESLDGGRAGRGAEEQGVTATRRPGPRGAPAGELRTSVIDGAPPLLSLIHI